MQTTLNKIKKHSPCGLLEPKNTEKGWGKLLNNLNKTQADDEPLELRTILESNGLDDTIWALRAVEEKDKEIRLFAADCEELVLPIYEKKYPDDNRPHLAIKAARDYANGLITLEELSAARAVCDAARAARDAARAAREAAREAVWAARGARAASDAAWDKIKQLLLKYI